MPLRLHSRLAPAATERLVAMVAAPDAFPAEARPVRGTGYKQLWIMTVEGRRLFVKVVRPRRPIAGFEQAFKVSSGLQTWAVALQAEAAGIAIPAPVAAGEKRALGRRLVWSFYACQWVPDPRLQEILGDVRGWAEAARQEAFARRLGRAFRALADRGLIQPDLKPPNFLVRGDLEGAFALIPLDLRSCRITTPAEALAWPKTPRKLRARILDGLPPSAADAFFEAYFADAAPAAPAGQG